MFQGKEFVYAGVPSSAFGLYLANVGSKSNSDNSFGTQGDIVETRIANRITPLHFGVNYSDDPLEFTLVFGSERRMTRYDLQEVADWLMGYQEYQWLNILQPDLEHIQFKCLITKLTTISAGQYPIGFQANVVCDCPYGYSYPFEFTYDLSGTTSITFYNEGTRGVKLRPVMEIELASGCTELTVVNTSNGDETFSLTGLPAGGISITVDNENGVMTENTSGYDLYDYFNFTFLELPQGANELEVTGTGTLTLKGRYFYNVGA